MDDLQSNAIIDVESGVTRSDLADYGPIPIVIDIDGMAMKNTNFRTTLWTGRSLQLTLMSLLPREEIGVEMHENLDQFIKIVEGYAVVKMGTSEKILDLQADLTSDDAVIIPAGTYHNIINTGYRPLKLISLYGPPAHPFNTTHVTKRDAMAAEEKASETN